MRSRKDWNGASLGQKLAAAAGLLFLHAPVWVIVLYAFTTEDRTYQFPPPGLTLHWFEVAFAREDIWAAMRLSLMVAAVATALAILLGTLAAFAMARRQFAGKESITLLFVLPIALPGIITGISLLFLFISADVLDGTMARLSGTQGPWGAWFDATRYSQVEKRASPRKPSRCSKALRKVSCTTSSATSRWSRTPMPISWLPPPRTPWRSWRRAWRTRC